MELGVQISLLCTDSASPCTDEAPVLPVRGGFQMTKMDPYATLIIAAG